MSLKQYITIAVSCLGGLALNGCSDSNNMVGSTIQPDGDFASVYTDTFQIKASTIKIDSIYAKTTEGLLGEIYDPLYGHLKANYLCQFYCEEDFKFYQTPIDGKIDSMDLYIDFQSFTGDPQASLQTNAYPVNKSLDNFYYTNINPDEYVDMKNPLANTIYTIASSFLDSISNPSGIKYPYYRIRMRLPIELGQKFYDETINNPSSFSSQDAFNRFFPGLYLTTNYGSGNIINVLQTYMMISYDYLTQSSSGALDSVLTAYEKFTATKGVIQQNHMESYDEAQLLAENENFTYLKTPAGIFTRLVVPTKEIKEIADGRIFNSLFLNLKYMPQEEWMYSLQPPPQLLLIPEDSLDTFLKETNVENNVNSYLSVNSNSPSITPTSTLSGYNAATRTYYFNNIVNMISYHIEKNPDENLRLLVVPIKREYNPYSSGTSTLYSTSSLSNYFMPSGLKLRKDEESMKVVLTSSNFPNK